MDVNTSNINASKARETTALVPEAGAEAPAATDPKYASGRQKLPPIAESAPVEEAAEEKK